MSIHKELGKSVSGARQKLGVERSQTTPYFINIGSFTIFQPRGFSRSSRNRFSTFFVYKHIPKDVIFEIIGKFSEGASLEEIMLGLSPSIPRRTLQRWLSILVKTDQLAIEGKARAGRYKLPLLSFFVHDLIPFSKQSEDILLQVTRPIQSRHPTTFE